MTVYMTEKKNQKLRDQLIVSLKKGQSISCKMIEYMSISNRKGQRFEQRIGDVKRKQAKFKYQGSDLIDNRKWVTVTQRQDTATISDIYCYDTTEANAYNSFCDTLIKSSSTGTSNFQEVLHYETFPREGFPGT